MKKTPETKPNKDTLKRFLAWCEILKKPVDECLIEGFEIYERFDQSTYPVHLIEKGDQHTFIFEIDMERWERFKRYAKTSYGHSRDIALTIAMQYFVDMNYQNLGEIR